MAFGTLQKREVITSSDNLEPYGVAIIDITDVSSDITATLQDGSSDVPGVFKLVVLKTGDSVPSINVDVSYNGSETLSMVASGTVNASYALFLWDGSDWQLISSGT